MCCASGSAVRKFNINDNHQRKTSKKLTKAFALDDIIEEIATGHPFENEI